MMRRLSGDFVPVSLRAPRTSTTLIARPLPSARPNVVVHAVDMGFSSGKTPTLALYKIDGQLQLHYAGNEIPFVYGVDKAAHTIDRISLMSGIRTAIIGASKQFEPSIPRIVTVDTMGAGLTVIGPGEREAVPMILYTNPLKAAGHAAIAEILGAGDESSALLNLQLACAGQVKVDVYNLFHLAGLRRNGLDLSSQYRILNLPDFILRDLSENNVEVTEPSFVRVTLCGDRTALNWNSELLSRLAINCRFPSIVPTGQDLGSLELGLIQEMNAESARLTAGLTHDTAGSVAGLEMCTDPDDITESSGSWDILCAPIKADEITDEIIRELYKQSLGVEGGTGNEFIAANVKGGMLVEDLLKDLGMTGDGRFDRLFAGIADESMPYALIDLESNGFLYKQGEGIKEAIEKWCWNTNQVFEGDNVGFLAKTIAMSIIMGKVERINQLRTIMGMLGRQPKSVQAGGGFAMNNQMLTQAFADACNLKVRLRFKGLSGIGNAAIALVGAGHATRDQMRQCLEELSSQVVFEPAIDAATRALWDRVYRRYLDIKEKAAT
ncbi:MAG: hypothetical protein WC527_01695 [Candidatus Margulisiibacteriota bacterium]